MEQVIGDQKMVVNIMVVDELLESRNLLIPMLDGEGYAVPVIAYPAGRSEKMLSESMMETGI